MRAIIAGGRSYVEKPGDRAWLDRMRVELGITLVVCGMAKGADALGYDWAKANGLPVLEYPPNWKKHGRSAGPRRNVLMAVAADLLLVFPGGRETAHMVMTMHQLKKPVYQRFSGLVDKKIIL